ncbi:hypothetical protein NXY56_000780 [Leishmania guyanensis]|uniref:Putative TATE DNA transposons n=1 Tax=Leishmania guyanensis TaxID=5670 RepID=A0A1E1IPX5_LEIGU|nr:Putative TATE DNA transposons [Leishmania guyanensis]
MSDNHERLTEAELDRTLKVYLSQNATRPMAEIAKKQYMEGRTNTKELLEVTAAMTESLMEAHNIFADKEIQEVMGMEDKWKEARARIKAAKDPLEGYKSKMESAILAHQMSPMVAATATILLGLSGPESQELSADERIAEWLSIFVDETCSSRLLAYNVQVAESVAGGMRQWRKVLKRLDAPLVPETERLAHLNCITLEAAQNEKRGFPNTIEGGGPNERRPRDIFRIPPRDGSDPMEGGAPYAPILGADGSQIAALDMGGFEAQTEERRLQTKAPKNSQGQRVYHNAGQRNGNRGNAGDSRRTYYRGGEAQDEPK